MKKTDPYANHKYPAHSTGQQTAMPVQEKHPPAAWKIGVVGLLILGLIWGALVSRIGQPTENTSKVAYVGTPTPTPFQPLTNTPVDTALHKSNSVPSSNEPGWEALAADSSPSATPWPSFTPTETATPKPLVEHIEVTRLVEVTVERVITATPAPWTPSATLEPTATDLPVWLIQAKHDAEMTLRREQIGIRLAEFFLSPASIMTILVLLVGIFGIRITVRWSTNKLDQAAGYETRAEIKQRADQGVDDSLTDILELLRESARRYGPGEQRLAGWREMVELDVKWSADYWSAVIQDLEALGLRTIRQAGIGTFLAKNTIRTAKLFILRLMPTPSPTAGERS